MGNSANKIAKKYPNFRCKSGKLAIQIKDDYYINSKNAQIKKIVIIFPKIWTRKEVDGLPMQNEGKTDKKIVITFLSDDFSAPSESRICEYRL